MSKKVLSLVLALVMVLGTFGTAFAASYQDTANTVYAEPVNRLSTLGILKGYPDGSFKPEGQITRAEFAAVAVRAKGLEAAANAAKGLATGFTDVPAAHWASGYVGTAGRLGVVNGVGSGLFAPEAPVKYEEAITMLVRALGYEPSAQAKGGYPYGYLIVANEIGLLDDVKGTQGVAATRGIVAQLADNALEIEMMIQVGFGSDTKWVVSGTEDTTEKYLLDELGFDSVKGRVISVNTKTDKITVDPTDEDLKNVTLDVEEGFDFYEVEGLETKFWYKDDVVVVYALQEEAKFDAVEVDGDELLLVEEDESYEVARGAYLELNGDSKVKAENFDADYAKVVLNEDDEIIWAEGYKFDDFIIFEKLDDEVILGYGEELDAEDFLITKDGKTIDLEDLVEGDVVFYNNAREFANVYNNSVEGEISRIYTNRFTLDGSDYKAVNTHNDAKYINEKGDIAPLADNFEIVMEAMQENGEVAVFLNRYGEMVYVTGDLGDLITTSSYVMVTKTTASYNNRGTAMWTLDVINSAGEEVKYDIKASDVDATGNSLLKDTDGSNKVWGTSVITEKTVLELEIDKDGDIDQINLLTPNAKGPDAAIKTSSRYLDGDKIESGAPVFLVEDYTDDVDDIVVTTYAELDFDFIDQGTFFVDGTKVVAIVVADSDREDDSETHLTVATADDDKVSGKNIWTLKLVIDGAKATFDTKEDIADPAVVKGDLLEVKIDNNTGKVNVVTKITSSARVVSGLVSDISTSNKSLKIGGTTTKLGVDAVVVDATDSYKVISLSTLKAGDSAKALLVSDNSAYAEVIVRTAKAGSTPVVTPGTGVVTFINAAGIEVDGTIYPITSTTSAKYNGVTVAIGGIEIATKIVAGDKVEVEGNVITITESTSLAAAAAAKALADAKTAATAAQAAYITAGGLNTDAVYTDVTTAVASNVTATIVAKTEALKTATKALTDALQLKVDAVNNATTVAQMRTALEDAGLGLDLTAYNALLGAQKDIVANAMIGGTYANVAAIQTALDAAI